VRPIRLTRANNARIAFLSEIEYAFFKSMNTQKALLRREKGEAKAAIRSGE
jgi:hypothetical protein